MSKYSQSCLSWLESGKHLPVFLRDFHDAKLFFRMFHSKLRKAMVDSNLEKITWVDSHIFIIDFFLWFMAKRGYTLQKTHKKLSDKVNLKEEIKLFDEQETERAALIFKEAFRK